jgi:RHS repeat-associated protein
MLTRKALRRPVFHRIASVVALAVLPGLLALQPGPAHAAAAKVDGPRFLAGSSPKLEFPEPAIPSGDSSPMTQHAPFSYDRPAFTDSRPGTELVERRDAVTEVFSNGNGTETIFLHTQPVHYKPSATAAWEKIDNSLVPSANRPGWVRNRANSWQVEFGPIEPGGVGGVELSTGKGVVKFAPELQDGATRTVLPVVGTGDKADTVTYANVWPGVDVVYKVSALQVKESIVVRKGARADYPFLVRGLGLAAEATQLTGTQQVPGMPRLPKTTAASAGGWQFSALDVADGSGRVTNNSGVAARVEAADSAQRLVVSVDKTWLTGQAAGAKPVVVDPSFELPATGSNWACSYLIFESLREETMCDGIRTGTHHSPGDPWGADGRYWWRSVAKFGYRSYVEGKDIISASIYGNEYDELGLGYEPEPVNVWDAIAANAAGAVANGDWIMHRVDEKLVPPNPQCYWGIEVCWDVTDRMRNWQFVGEMGGAWDDGMFGFSGEEDDLEYMLEDHQTYKRFMPGDIRLALNVNTRPPAPVLQAPADGALAIDTLTPVITWKTVDDADGHEVRYTVKVATSPDAETGSVVSSSELTEPAGATQMSWTVPDGVLRDGITYYWKVVAHDIAWDNGGGAFVPSAIRKLTVDRRMGLGGMSPSDAFGGVATNLVTGNVSLAVSGPQMPSIGGGVGVSFVYNGRDARSGLKATYRDDVDRDHVIESSDPVRLVRTDPEVRFEWNADSPSPGVPLDYFTANWSGSIRLPSGKNWQLGLRADDGTKLRYDNAQVIDSWGALQPNPFFEPGTHPGGTTKAISLDYYEHTGPAYVQLYARESLGGGSYGTPFIIPESWLSPELPGMPSGWSLQAADANVTYTKATVNEGSVTLTAVDGETVSFARNQSGTYTPPPGIEDLIAVNTDGTVAVHEDNGMDYSFRPDGGLSTVRTPLDDRRPAAALNTFDANGNLIEVTDPVSGRKVTLRYAASDGDSACPNSPPLGGTSYESETGMLCRVTYWDGSKTDLFYFKDTDLLSHIANPGDTWWGFSYDSTARLVGVADPNARDVLFSGNRSDSDLNRLFTQIAYDPATSGLKSRVQTVTLPAAMQSDATRQTRTYSYTQNVGGGILVDGTASVTRSGVSGVYRSVKFDYRGRGVEDTNAEGQTVKTFWDSFDRVYATEGADGMLTSTLYNNRHEPTDIWGPAPESLFTKIWYGVDLWLPKDGDCLNATAAMTACDVGRSHTNYDEGIDGLQVKWWNNSGANGPVIAHGYDPGQLRDSDSSGRPEGISADNAGARYTGNITFPQAGDFKMQICVGQADAAWLFVDGRQVTQEWLPDASAPSRCSSTASWTTWVHSGGAGERHSIQVNYADFANADLLHLNWTRPDGVYEPVSGLTPAFDLATSSSAPDGTKTSRQYADAANGVGPQHGLVTKSIVDPGGLNLTTATTYEPASGWNGFLRPLGKTLPGGDLTKTTNTYYVADNPATTTVNEAEVRDNPCTAATDPANQAGMLKLDAAADPDGNGPATSVVRERVYDATGRVVATRIGSEAWTCTTYDGRNRVLEVKYPAFGGQPARTVTNTHAVDPDGTGPKGPSPLLTTTSDSTGTITTEIDLLGQLIAYRDVLGYQTTFTYDAAGREQSSNGPAGLIEKSYDSTDRLTQFKRNGQVLANSLVYNAQNSRLESVTYPSGTGNGGNGTKGTFTFDPVTGRLQQISWTNAATGALITSDAVTRNAVGDLTGKVVDGVDHHAGNDYVYDNAGRLLDAYVPGRRIQYEYGTTTTAACGANTLTTAGANTNRTKQTVTPTGGAATVTTYCYDRADRLTSASDAAVGALTYDGHGNATAIFGETHQYDATDRHMATVKGSTTVSYVRDATDRIVERRVNGAVVGRYGATGSGDAPDFSVDCTGQIIEVTLGLPGGAMLTTRTIGNVWSYPDIHGDVAATANGAGAKQGPTFVSDPFGNQVTAGAMPDNSNGNLDYGWLGQYQRPTEHEATLQPVIEMGARQYSPLLGRFIEVDPVEGGSCNDYDYVCGDPVNGLDLDGNRGFHNTWFGVNCSWSGCTLYLSKRLVRNLAAILPRGWTPRFNTNTFCTTSKLVRIKIIMRAICAVGLVDALGGFMQTINKAKNQKSCVQMKIGWEEMLGYGISIASGGTIGALAAALASEMKGAKVSDRKSKCHNWWKS